jgi:hypothetical protein
MARRRIVRWVLVMLWMLMFEGAIRKWLAPHFSAYLYFMRDPIAIWIYLIALRNGLFMRQPHMLMVGLAIAAVAILLSGVHLASGGQYTPILALYGIRNYFLYMPLPFVIARCFKYQDVCSAARCTMIAMIIAAPIAVLQFWAAPDSVLNAGIATEQAYQFENLASGSGRVRPAGTFTSVMGMTQLTVANVALLMWAWGSPRQRRPVGAWLLVPAAIATATALAVGGSRTSFIQSVLVIVTGVAISPLLPAMSSKLKGVVLPLIAAAAFATLFPIVFPEAFQTFADRWNDAASTESQQFQLGWIGRIFYSFYDFGRLLGQIPLAGYGVGTGGNGAVSMGVSIQGVSVLKLAEEDWSRHVIELGPPLAIVFILFRASLGAWVGRLALRATLASGDPLPVLLFAYCGVALVEGQLTGHGLVNGFGWLYAGLCLAASGERQGRAVSERVRVRNANPVGALPGQRFPNLLR